MKSPSAPIRSRRRIRKLHVAILVASLCAAAMLWLAAQSWYGLNQLMSERENLQGMRAAVGALVDDLLVAEVGQRGYLLTEDTQFLRRYENASMRVANHVEQLHANALPEIQQSGDMLEILEQLTDKLEEMNLALRLAKDMNAPDAAKVVVSSDVDVQRVPDFHTNADELNQFIDALISQKTSGINRLLNTSGAILIASIALAWLIFVLYARQRQILHDSEVQRRQRVKRRSARWESLAHRRAERLAELATYLQTAAEDERARLARELHDELGALMTAAKLDLARIQRRIGKADEETHARLQHLNNVLNQSVTLERRIIEDLRPSSLASLGLVATLDILAREWQAATGIEIDTQLEPVALDDARELTLYRLAQEALTNIARHARASKASIVLAQVAGRAQMVVEDDGQGFDPEAIGLKSHGLAGMRHRLEACGGSLAVRSARGQGTRIVGRV